MLYSGDLLVHNTTKGIFKLEMGTLVGTLILYLIYQRGGIVSENKSKAIFVHDISEDLKLYSSVQI
jgi:hypothetical protein